MSEIALQKACVDFMLAHNWRHLRTHFVAVVGMAHTLEPGICDSLFVKYMPSEHAPWRALVLFVEYKSPHDRRTCFCQQKAIQAAQQKKRRASKCSFCRQKDWQTLERSRGAVVWVVNDLDDFIKAYQKEFGWLHRDQPDAPMQAPRGQMTLLE